MEEDAELLHHLFVENNELRSKTNALRRELFNQTALAERVEEELKNLKRVESERERTEFVKPQTTNINRPLSTNGKELNDALSALEKKTKDLSYAKDEILRLSGLMEKQKTEFELVGYKEDYCDLQLKYQEMALQHREMQNNCNISVTIVSGRQASISSSSFLQTDTTALQDECDYWKLKVKEIAADAAQSYNDQQNQLHGLEKLLEKVKKEYDAFLDTTRIETESFKKQQQDEFGKLQSEFEQYKVVQQQDKRKIMNDYQQLINLMQSQFDEYRITAGFLFNAETARLEDELTSQASRYEQEIVYIVQAKDRFYADMMVVKDAKIMGLIEGSDLQSVLQRHEMNVEALRKEHAKEIERVKTEHESEQKNHVALLQKQNMSLEGKCEKLQTYIKSLETKAKDILAMVDAKSKIIADKEEQMQRMESDFIKQLDVGNRKIDMLTQEKEHLRHKVIRMSLEARGEGENTIDNMIKRLSRESVSLAGEYEVLCTKYQNVLTENEKMEKSLKQKENLANFLEREVKRRTEEYQIVTKTFEQFLKSRERRIRMNRLHQEKDEPTSRSIAMGSMRSRNLGKESSKVEFKEVDQGYNYLKRFKTLSKAFATGEFKYIPSIVSLPEVNDPFAKVELYARLEETVAIKPKIYGNPMPEIASKKQLVYNPPTNDFVSLGPKKSAKKKERKANESNMLVIGKLMKDE